MLRLWTRRGESLRRRADDYFPPAGEKGIECRDLGQSHALMNKAVWIDLFEPTEQEEIIVDMVLGIDLPTRREMQDIEVSRRLYKEDNALFMTVTILTKADTSEPESTAVTFIFVDNRLITLRYADPSVFKMFRRERESELARYDSGQRILEGLSTRWSSTSPMFWRIPAPLSTAFRTISFGSGALRRIRCANLPATRRSRAIWKKHCCGSAAAAIWFPGYERAWPGCAGCFRFLPRRRSTFLPKSPSICGRSVRTFNRWAITLRFSRGK